MKIQYVTRPASFADDPEQIAELIYGADQHVYSAWFGNFLRARPHMKELIRTPGSVYYHQNIHVMQDLSTGRIMGAVVTLTRDGLYFNYDRLKAISEQYRQAIESYIEPAVTSANELAPHSAIIFNLSIDQCWRRERLSEEMLQNYLHLMKRRGFVHFELNCQADNAPALACCQAVGFCPSGTNVDSKIRLAI